MLVNCEIILATIFKQASFVVISCVFITFDSIVYRYSTTEKRDVLVNYFLYFVCKVVRRKILRIARRPSAFYDNQATTKALASPV